MKRLLLGLSWLCLAWPVHAAPGKALDGVDADTRAWWDTTAVLADDNMEGRDTGSPAHARAAAYVVQRFKAAGLQPAGDGGGWTQTVPLSEVRVDPEGTWLKVIRDGAQAPIRFAFLREATVTPFAGMPADLDAPLVFRGYCSREELGADSRGKIAVCFQSQRKGLPGAADRAKAAAEAGAVALIGVDDPGFTIEPPRWPAAYARTIRLAGDPSPAPTGRPVVMRLSSDGFIKLLAGTDLDATGVLKGGAAKQPLPRFDIPERLTAHFQIAQAALASDNVLALLPGTDPKLKAEVVVVSAHLDGYGFGEPVNGDTLYNGAFDDAAYVAALIRLAERRHGEGLRRSVLFAVFTGEEKGLLGSRWFVAHPTVAKDRLVADLNLDMVRPLFPLKALTMLAIGDTTLTDQVRAVGKSMDVDIRPDLEPERGLLQRADHWPFLQAGVPATGFLFAYDPGTEAERRFREWYNVRYHRPQDDLGQPIDMTAAARFNRFFYTLTEHVADADEKPAFLPTSALKPKP